MLPSVSAVAAALPSSTTATIAMPVPCIEVTAGRNGGGGFGAVASRFGAWPIADRSGPVAAGGGGEAEDEHAHRTIIQRRDIHLTTHFPPGLFCCQRDALTQPHDADLRRGESRNWQNHPVSLRQPPLR